VLVMDIMKKTVTCDIGDTLEHAAQLMVTNQVNHIPIISEEKLVGIITSWDIAKALATEARELKDFMTKDIITVEFGDTIEVAAIKMNKHKISALPVVDRTNKLMGIITSEDISKLMSVK